MASMSALWPKRCTGMMALVFEVILAAALTASILKQIGQESTKTGVAPVRATQPAVAKKVKVGTRTSSPGPMPRAISANKMASVPEEQPMPCFASTMAAHSFSKASTSGPMMNWPDLRTLVKAAVSSDSSGRFCALTSSNGTFILENRREDVSAISNCGLAQGIYPEINNRERGCYI